MGKIDHELTAEIICPYCGYEFSDSWDYGDPNSIEFDCHEIDCEECGWTFLASKYVDIKYNTCRISCGKGKHKYKLKKDTFSNPYIYNGKNWTLWECEICEHEVTKTGPLLPENAPEPYIIPISEEEQ